MQLRGLGRKQAERAVTALCSRFGTVRHVALIPLNSARWNSACVEMSTHAETLTLMRRFGGEKVVSAVVLDIESLEKYGEP